MLSITNPFEIQVLLAEKRRQKSRIGFVPTMGALHPGHISLVQKARKECDFVVVSVFVNPTQFGPNEDFNKYPRTIEADAQLLADAGVDLLFLPGLSDIYPASQPEIGIVMTGMDKILEGKTRPGHFNGVLLVLARFFNIIGPCKAFFGLKDFQQVAVVKNMVSELFFPVEIISCETMRETDGLAMSSRNRYLNPDERQDALFLSEALNRAKKLVAEGKTTLEIQADIQAFAIKFENIRLDYFEIVQASDLNNINQPLKAENPVALVAAWCGKTRLIDNAALIS